MTTTLLTATGLNLNDGVRFVLRDIDLGSAERAEAWIESWWSDAPVLSNFVERKSKLTITLRVNGQLTAGGANTLANLSTNVKAVRDAFDAQNNTLTYGIGTGILNDIPTFPSPIDPVPYDVPLVTKTAFLIPAWTFSIWRAGNYTDATSVVL